MQEPEANASHERNLSPLTDPIGSSTSSPLGSESVASPSVALKALGAKNWGEVPKAEKSNKTRKLAIGLGGLLLVMATALIIVGVFKPFAGSAQSGSGERGQLRGAGGDGQSVESEVGLFSFTGQDDDTCCVEMACPFAVIGTIHCSAEQGDSGVYYEVTCCERDPQSTLLTSRDPDLIAAVAKCNVQSKFMEAKPGIETVVMADGSLDVIAQTLGSVEFTNPTCNMSPVEVIRGRCIDQRSQPYWENEPVWQDSSDEGEPYEAEEEGWGNTDAWEEPYEEEEEGWGNTDEWEEPYESEDFEEPEEPEPAEEPEEPEEPEPVEEPMEPEEEEEDEPMKPEEEEEEEPMEPEEEEEVEIYRNGESTFLKGNLVWEDNFDGNAVNEDIWIIEVGNGCPDNCFFGNNEEQSYQRDSCQVRDGMLHMMGEPWPQNPAADDNMVREGPWMPFTSCKMHTTPAYSILTGRMEITTQIVKGGGSWPSIFMLPDDESYGNWPASGEMDILETVNTASDVTGSLHYGDTLNLNDPNSPKGQNGCKSLSGVDYSEGFHTFALEWRPASISWFIDGRRYCMAENWFTSGANPAENPQAPYDQPFHLILNLAIGGDWPGQVDAETMPWDMMIDRVAVYDLTPEGEAYEGERFPGPVYNPANSGLEEGGEPSPYHLNQNENPVPWPMPSRLSATAFDDGGQDVGFYDYDPYYNNGDSSIRRHWGPDLWEEDRTLYVDKFTTTYGPFADMQTGEWMAWTVECTENIWYWINVRAASPGLVHYKVLVDSKDCWNPPEGSLVTERQEANQSNGNRDFFYSYQVPAPRPEFSAGQHQVVFCAMSDLSFSFLEFGRD